MGSRALRRGRRHSLAGLSRNGAGGGGEQGDFEIRAWIQAELLGIRLLTVESRVVTGQPRSFRKAMSPPVVSSGAKGPTIPPTPRGKVPPTIADARRLRATQTSGARRQSKGGYQRHGLEQAMVLLDSCTQTLEQLSLNGGPRWR